MKKSGRTAVYRRAAVFFFLILAALACLPLTLRYHAWRQSILSIVSRNDNWEEATLSPAIIVEGLSSKHMPVHLVSVVHTREVLRGHEFPSQSSWSLDRRERLETAVRSFLADHSNRLTTAGTRSSTADGAILLIIPPGYRGAGYEWKISRVSKILKCDNQYRIELNGYPKAMPDSKGGQLRSCVAIHLAKLPAQASSCIVVISSPPSSTNLPYNHTWSDGLSNCFGGVLTLNRSEAD